MKKIGLIAGMSWENSAIYYRYVNTLIKQKIGGIHSAEILIS
jgi:aspartate racemase